MLLMGAIVAVSLPRILGGNAFSSRQQLDLAVRGLLALVLIFNVIGKVPVGSFYSSALELGFPPLSTQLRIAAAEKFSPIGYLAPQ